MKFKTVMQTFNAGKPYAKRVPVRVGFCPHCKDWITAVGDGIATHSPCKGPCGVQIRMGLMESGWSPDQKQKVEVWRRGPQIKVLPY